MKSNKKTTMTKLQKTNLLAVGMFLLAASMPLRAEQQAQSGMDSIIQVFSSAMGTVPAREGRDLVMACIGERFIEWGETYLKVVDGKIVERNGSLGAKYNEFKKKMTFVVHGRDTFEMMRFGIFKAIKTIFDEKRASQQWPSVPSDMTLVDPKLDDFALSIRTCHSEEYKNYILNAHPEPIDYEKIVAVTDFYSIPDVHIGAGGGGNMGFQGASLMPEITTSQMSYFEFLDELSSIH